MTAAITIYASYRLPTKLFLGKMSTQITKIRNGNILRGYEDARALVFHVSTVDTPAM